MAQRITNNMMITNFNRNLNRNNVKMQQYQMQLATNRKMVRISDDPIGLIKSLNARSKLSSVEQFQRNLEGGRSWLTQSETAASELNEVIKRAYELSVRLADEIKTPEDRQAVAFEIKELMDHVVTVANTTLGDKYLFGGYNVTKAPFEVNSSGQLTFNGVSMVDDTAAVRQSLLDLDDVISYEIGFGIDMPISIKGSKIMGLDDKNIYQVMADFYKDANDAEIKDLSGYIGKFQELQKNTLTVMSEIGGRQNRLDLMAARFDQVVINYTQMKSDAEDLDQAEAIMWFSMAEAVYRAALNVGSRIIQPTLMDFLR